MSVTQDWYIDLTCTLTSPIDPDTALTITEHLAAAYAVASIADDGRRLELSMTVNAPNVIDAAVRARALVYGLELAQIDAIDALEARIGQAARDPPDRVPQLPVRPAPVLEEQRGGTAVARHGPLQQSPHGVGAGLALLRLA